MGPLLTKIQECHNFVRSLATSVDIPKHLKTEYATHYSNTLQISMNIDKSLEMEEEARHEPIPVSQAFHITGDNIRSIADVAYRTLTNEREFYTKLNEKIILKRALKEAGEDGFGPHAETAGKDDEAHKSVRHSHHSGKTPAGKNGLNTSHHKSAKRGAQPATRK